MGKSLPFWSTFWNSRFHFEWQNTNARFR